ncbi:hypothetical protein FHS34_001356 [Streptomyces echinatus]|uniref:Uncharacterized protein n=1 Tax=Streptomyces echinatus TaxID=67293 RepID=A0A7W9PR74_9ACTN|nr:hypothetical protein [Streptomyces echinatus]
MKLLDTPEPDPLWQRLVIAHEIEVNDPVIIDDAP